MSKGQVVKVYDYVDEGGQLLYQNCRFGPKDFRPRRPDRSGGFIWDLGGVSRTLYRLPELLQSSKQDWTFITEGEKDSDTLSDLGLTATTSGSSTSWKPEFAKHFQGRLVCITPDNDPSGQLYAKVVSDSLYGKAAEIRILNLPGLGDGEDVSDWLNNSGTVQKLLELVDQTEQYRPAPEIEVTAACFNLTDAGNAERLAERHAAQLRWVWGWNKWVYYDGTRWNAERGAEMAQRLAVETVRSIIAEAQNKPEQLRAALIKFSLASESTARINALLTAARAVEGLSAYPKDFDTDLMQFNCVSGTIDLKTGELRPHNPADFITKLSPVKYDAGARFELWDQVLQTATDGDAELQDFLQTAVGYSLTGNVGEEKLFFVHGPTATSKSTFLEAVKAALGDYAATADFESFLRKPPQGGVLRNDIASLAGKRFVTSIEVDEGRKLAEGLIKILTGGDEIKARFLYQEGFEFMPQCKLWLAANHEPKVSDNDDAIWRRIVKVPFTHAIPKADRRPTIKATLRNPAIAGPAILAWAIKGCLRWQREGLRIPEVVETATESYRLEQDPLKEFCEEVCLFDPGAYVPVAEMRTAYENHTKENGIRFPLSVRQFNRRIEGRGCERKSMRILNDVGTERVVKCWCGVTLADNPKKLQPELIQDEIPI